MIERITALILCIILCIGTLFGCAKSDLEIIRVFKTVLPDMKISTVEDGVVHVELPPALTSIETDVKEVTLLTGETSVIKTVLKQLTIRGLMK